MIAGILLGAVLLYLAVSGAVGLLWRGRRAAVVPGIVRPLFRTGLCFALVVAGLCWIVVSPTQWALVLGFFAGEILFLFILGWDEFYDRITPGFYASVRRETGSYFGSGLSWFVLLLFVIFMGLRFWGALDQYEVVSMQLAFVPALWVVWFLFPLLTMGTFSREKAEGTEEVLMTAPVSEVSVVVAKFLGIVVFYLAMLVPSLVEFGILRSIGQSIGKPDTGVVVTSYIGMLLQGAMFAALGIFASSLTPSQILAAILSWMVTILLLFSKDLSTSLGFAASDLGTAIEYVNPLDHVLSFFRGVADPKDVVYFLSFTVFFLFLSVRATESRKWR